MMRHGTLDFFLPLSVAVALALAPGTSNTMHVGGADGRSGDFMLVADSAIVAPVTVDPGQKVQVSVADTAPGKRIELWGPVTSEGKGEKIDSTPVTNGVAELTAPGRAGSYELRHVNERGTVVARREFEVAAVPVSLKVPLNVTAGGSFEIVWSGPAQPGDRLEIVDASGGKVLESTAVAGHAASRNASTLIAPEIVGKARVRYVTSDGVVLQSISITISHGKGWLRTPIAVNAGERFEVQWYGAARPGHVVRIVDPATGTEISSVTPDGPAFGPLSGTLVAPRKPGKYQIEYADPAAGEPASQLPLRVTAR